MATTNEPTLRPLSITKGDPTFQEELAITTMTEAMELARQTVRSVIDEDPDPYGYTQESEEAFGVDLLNPQWKAKKGDTRWTARVKARARKTAVVRQFLLGYTPSEIAKRLKLTETLVHSDLRHAEREWRRTYLDDIEILAGKDLARYDMLLSKLAPAINKGDVKAIIAAAEIIDKRANILGYKQGLQIDISQYVMEVAEANGYDPQKALAIASRISMNMRG